MCNPYPCPVQGWSELGGYRYVRLQTLQGFVNLLVIPGAFLGAISPRYGKGDAGNFLPSLTLNVAQFGPRANHHFVIKNAQSPSFFMHLGENGKDDRQCGGRSDIIVRPVLWDAKSRRCKGEHVERIRSHCHAHP